MVIVATVLIGCVLAGAAANKALADRARAQQAVASHSAVKHAQTRASAALAAAMRNPAARANLQARLARAKQQARSELRASMPRPHLSRAQRPLWIAAWNQMRACALEHGFEGVSEVEPSYGDGKTPMPNVDMDRPNAQVALAACPFDSKGIDLRALAASAEERRR
jgi:hypothetical protein